jgi:hypothetical protein
LHGRSPIPTRRSVAFATACVFLAGLLPACLSSVTEPGAPIPPDHDESENGAFHKAGAEEPFVHGNSCFAYHCHHANLRGGWAIAKTRESEELIETYAPSCYQCHGVEWDDPDFETIQITYPFGEAVEWPQGVGRLVEWVGPPADRFTVDLRRVDGDASVLIATLLNDAPSDGVLEVPEVRADWGHGPGFFVRVRDDRGRHADGLTFTIAPSGGGGRDAPGFAP